MTAKQTISFFDPMIPPTATHQEKKFTARHGRIVAYDPPEVKDARAKLLAYVAKYKPDEPMTGPVSLTAAWHFPITEGHANGKPKTTKPDTDNMQKLLKDVMTKAGFWKDDAQVFSEVVVKIYSKNPGINIIVEEMEV